MLFGVVPFVLGLSGIVLYALWRSIEIRRQSRAFEATRARLDVFATRLYRLFVFGELPATYRARLAKFAQSVAHSTVMFLVSMLRAVERPLSRLSHRMRVIRAKENKPPDSSSFLKTLSSSKRKDGEKPTDSV